MVLIVLLYIAVALLICTYLLYPLAIWLLGTRFPAISDAWKPYDRSEWPMLSVLLAAHNEEEVIADKIENFLDGAYPGKSEMVIVSDGSSDRTAQIARTFASDRVVTIETRERKGKGAAIDLAARSARGEILIYTDANTFFDRNALTALARPFANSDVGLVTGCTHYPERTIASAYQRYEQMLKRFESLSGVVATADGAIYAMRRSLWRSHDPTLVNDFLHPILAALEGKLALIAPDAICHEQFSMGNEFRRQVRMVSLASYVYVRFLPQLLRAGRWRSVLVLTSHKLLRWLTAPLLAIAVVTTVMLAPSGGIYRLALETEALLAALAIFGAIAERLGLDERAGFIWQFVALNCACALGLLRGLSGNVPAVWHPRQL
jgi:poly-beta-1,6-N-acetyl-D-glucosamine synthase